MSALEVGKVLEVGDVEFLRPWSGDSAMWGDAALLVPVVMESGQRFELRFDAQGSRKIWEFLSVVRHEMPGLLGVQ
jgi:hypothetical protein